MKKHSFLLIITISTLISCDNEVPNMKPYIQLSQNELTIGSSGDSKNVYVISNCNWVVTNTPDWCLININKDVEKPYIEIIVTPNEEQAIRNATIKITDSIVEENLTITQASDTSVQQINWHSFPINSITSVSYTLGSNGIERIYNISGSRLAINELTNRKVYHGNLINKTLNGLAHVIDYPKYTYNPITVGSFVNGRAFIKTISPSHQETERLSKEIAQSLPTQSLQFNYSSPIKYTSYKQLNLLGNGNLGINLEKEISGHLYLEKEMDKKNGLIYSYSMALFDIVMDNQVEIITEKITDIVLLSNLAYVKSINYGRVAYLLIETDEHEKDVNKLIRKIFKNEALDANETSLLSKLDAYYLYFDNDLKIKVCKGKEEIIKKYINSISDSNIIPLTFSIQSYIDHSVTNINYTVVLQ